MADPATFHLIENVHITLMQFLTAIPRGFAEAVWIIIMTLFVGGAFAIVQKIGLIPAMVESVAKRFIKKGVWSIPPIMFVFALIDAFIGTPELIIVYIPIILPLMTRLGFDSITACATVLCGSAAGFSAALTNPFTIAIGQKICGLPLYSGWQFRILTFAVTYLIGAAYLMHHAKKILAHPELSPTYEVDQARREKYNTENAGTVTEKLNTRQRIAGYFTLAVMAFMLFGIIRLKWDLPEMSAMFLVVGIGSGLIAGMGGNDICETFTKGFQDMMLGAMVIGISRAIGVVMSDGKIVDTVVHSLAGGLTQLPSSITILGILAIVTMLNFLVPSGSGKAVVLFPILAPLADIIGITRQTAIIAYQFGDGFTNYLWPTSGWFMAAIAICGITWQKWAKFYVPLFLLWLCSSSAFLLIAQAIHLGPF